MSFKNQKKAVKFSDYIVYSNIVVSFSSAILTYGLCVQLELPKAFIFAVFIGSSTMAIYTAQRIIKSYRSEYQSVHLEWIKQHRKGLLVLVLLASIGCGWIAIENFLTHFSVLFLLLISCIVSIAYVLPIRNKSLRDLPHLKIHLIALTWVVACGCFPLIWAGDYDLSKWLFVGSHYFLLIAVCIPFDIRDLPIDQTNQRTIPQVFGILKSKQLSGLSFFIYVTIGLSLSYLRLNILLILSILTFFYLLKLTTPKASSILYAVYWEFVIILLGLSFVFY